MHENIPDTHRARQRITSLVFNSRDLQSVERQEIQPADTSLEQLRDNRRPHRLQILSSALSDAANEELAEVLQQASLILCNTLMCRDQQISELIAGIKSTSQALLC